MSLANDLLEQANHLANRERLRPRQASLRRSISSSYYALFHHLTAETSDILCPHFTLPAWQRVQRWFDHGEMKRVCGMFSVPTPPKQLAAILGADISPQLQSVSQAFIQLQEARHGADYDLSITFTRLTAQQYFVVAQTAFANWSAIRRTHEANVFALALLNVKLFDRDR